MYLLEGDAQPEKLLPISLAMYSAIINLATVGYGDIHPVTAAGKVFARTAAVSGIVFFCAAGRLHCHRFSAPDPTSRFHCQLCDGGACAAVARLPGREPQVGAASRAATAARTKA